jgi:hypothetical protein
VSALDALIEDSLALISASHLARHVVHLLRVALWAILVHYDLFYTLVGFCTLFGCLHPLLSLVEFLLCNYLIPDQICDARHMLAESALGCGCMRSQRQKHTAVPAEDCRGTEGQKGLYL